MKDTPITLRLTLVGGKNITNRNAHLIRMEKKTPGCNVIGHPKIPNPKTYIEVYRIEKDFWDAWKDGKKTGRKQKGYSFVEVNHRMGGFGGIQKSVAKLVKTALLCTYGSSDRIIVIEGGVQ